EGALVQAGAGGGRQAGVAGGEAVGGFGHRVEGVGGGGAVAVGGRPGVVVRGAVLLGAGRPSVVVAAGDPYGEHHAHLPVPDHRAPAVQVPADDARVQRRPLPRGDPVGAGAGLQDQVVGVVTGVVQLDHQAVAR